MECVCGGGGAKEKPYKQSSSPRALGKSSLVWRKESMLPSLQE